MKKISSHILVSFLLVCFCIFSSSIFAAIPTYKLVDLGLQESDSSEALAVNDNGQVAGIYWLRGSKYYFLWNANTGIELLDLPETAIIKVLNKAGHIAGEYHCPGEGLHGFFWTQDLGFFDIGTLGGQQTSVADMNDHGQIVGGSYSASDATYGGLSERHAYMWQSGIMTDLGVLGGDLGLPGNDSVATGINNCGQIIGSSNYQLVYKGKLIPSGQKAVIWKNGIIEEFAPVFDGELRFNSINDKGLITSYSSNAMASHVVFDSRTKGTWNLFVGPAETTKINEVGNILTSVTFISMESLPSGSFCNKDIVVRNWVDLREVFKKIKTDPWKELQRVNDLNNSNWIVGVASNIYGEQHAVLFVPLN